MPITKIGKGFKSKETFPKFRGLWFVAICSASSLINTMSRGVNERVRQFFVLSDGTIATKAGVSWEVVCIVITTWAGSEAVPALQVASSLDTSIK